VASILSTSMLVLMFKGDDSAHFRIHRSSLTPNVLQSQILTVSNLRSLQ
jgi:hypothetical protein